MYVTKANFSGEVVGIVDNVVSIGQYEDGVFLLDAQERLLTLKYGADASVSTQIVASGVGYADGSADFIFYVNRDGTAVCASKHDICPPVDNLTGLVHQVSSANAEGITL